MDLGLFYFNNLISSSYLRMQQFWQIKIKIQAIIIIIWERINLKRDNWLLFGKLPIKIFIRFYFFNLNEVQIFEKSADKYFKVQITQ